MADDKLSTAMMCDNLAGLAPAIRHGFFTREGGVSTGLYGSLNVGLGSGDDREKVAQNRALVCEAFGGEADKLATVSQCHSADVVVAEGGWSDNRPRADAIVTEVPGLVIGILTADCGPVLFADGRAGIVGAAHAGWKGALCGVVENTVDAMIALGAQRKNIVATLGPAISQANYEVGADYREKFIKADDRYAGYFMPSMREDRFMFDLPGFVLNRLKGAGVEASWSGHCTYANSGKFYSYRRSVHNGEPDYGRQISAIMVQ